MDEAFVTAEMDRAAVFVDHPAERTGLTFAAVPPSLRRPVDLPIVHDLRIASSLVEQYICKAAPVE